MKFRRRPGSQRGFTIPELMVALAIGAIISAAAVNAFIVQRRSFVTQQQVSEMVQSARIGLDIIAREVRMAGYDPTEAGFDGIKPNDTAKCGSLAAGPRLRADLNADGDTNDENEMITYCYDTTNQRITRNTGGGNQAFLDTVTAASIVYLNENDVPTVTPSAIRKVRFSITTATLKPDPSYTSNGGHRTYTLTSTIAVRN